MKRLVLLLLLAGCHHADPQLVAVRDAIAAWQQGVDALKAGDPKAAQAHFEAARALRPGDPLLEAWEAKALADRGDLEGAIGLLDDALSHSPNLAEARYNRAAYAARLGRPEEQVAEDLERALADGARSPRDVLQDPDFAPILGHPAFDFLPSHALTVGVEAPESTVFWGTEFSVRFRVAGAGDDPLALTAEQAKGPVTPLSVVDDANPSTEGTFRDLTYSFRVVGAGEATFGPFHAWAGDRRTTLNPVKVMTAAPKGKTPPSSTPPIDFLTPREILGRADVPSARVVDGDLIVACLPGDKVVLDPKPSAAPIHYEQRDRGRTEFEVWRYPEVAPNTVHVKVARAGQAVYDAEASSGSSRKAPPG